MHLLIVNLTEKIHYVKMQKMQQLFSIYSLELDKDDRQLSAQLSKNHSDF